MKMTMTMTTMEESSAICGEELYYDDDNEDDIDEDDESEKIYIDKEAPVLPTLHKSTHPKLSTWLHSDKKMSIRSFAAALDDHQDNHNNPHNDVVKEEHLVRVA